MFSRSESGQASVEAAFLLPIMLVIFGAFLQPTMLLYNRCVMQSAAAETCRMVETNVQDDQAARAYALRRLGAVPHIPIFHEGADDQWRVEVSGGELASTEVTISNHARPLPLLGVVAGLAGQRASDGCIEQTVRVSAALAPTWARELGQGPGDWIGAWK